MTLCVFLAAGNITWVLGSDAFSDIRGLFRKMPVTMIAMVAGGLSIIGVPPTCGFFSKWYLLSGGIEAGHWGFVVALLFSSLVNAVLFFRIFEIGYFEPFSDAHGSQHSAVRMTEAPPGMLVPLLVTAGILLLLGVYSGDIAARIFQFVALAAA